MSAVIVPLHKGKGERIECKNYRSITLLSVVGKIYIGVLVDRIRIVTGGLIDDKQGGFRVRRGYVDQICILKQIGFIDLEKVFHRVDRKVLWQRLKMYVVRGKCLSGIKSLCMLIVQLVSE